jgi:CRISPR/Cas system-associated exonuclease Cas4 (RecB family)
LAVIIKIEMKTPSLKEINKWFVLMLFPIVGLFLLFHQTQRPKVESQKDLTYVKGRIKDYSFEYKSGGRAISRQFYILIQGYDCKFQIIADYLPYFQKSEFESRKEIGDSIRISIPKEDKKKLFENEKIIAMSINDKMNIYLSEKDTIAEEKTYFDIYAGLFFLTLGGIIYVLMKKGIIKMK